VRSALHRLAEEGLVSITPNKGAVVIGVSREDVISTYEIRTRLEGLASSLAAENITPEELSELRLSLELQEFYISRRDTEHLRELDTRFHYLIYKASGNRPLLKILGELHKNIKTYRKRSLSVPGRLEQSVAEHRQIFEAIAEHNAELADELTSRHIRCALENILSGG
jgi:DNA-binding GntR family transcriptional regulator